MPGRVIHTQGWPLGDAWGGGWIYHQANGQVSIGFVTWLNYSNPYLSPFGEMQKWKTHPAVAELLALSVTAGEGTVQALERVARVSRGELAAELDLALAHARTGASSTASSSTAATGPTLRSGHGRGAMGPGAGDRPRRPARRRRS